ncbi:MAG TPA: hypothetical protein VGJ84_10490 [Polyangiaceae bacterium]|jgi:ABC-type Na+ efflux pump permease subunit
MGLLTPVIALSVTSFGCWLIMLYVLFKEEGLASALFGLTLIYAFFWGWKNPRVRINSLLVGDVMTAWTWMMGAALVLRLIMGDKT